MQVHIIVTGEVQGVGFRMFTVRRAAELNITGWVRNLEDGSVEILAEGTRSNLDTLLSLVHEGPRMAQVDNVKFEFSEKEEGFTFFNVSE
jgi:acylphosphatase